jgi:hypothetical protein
MNSRFSSLLTETHVLCAAAYAAGGRAIFTKQYPVLEVPILGDEPVYDTDFNIDIVDGPLFDTYPNEERFLAAEFYTDPVVITAFDHESRDLSHVGADFDDGPLFDEASEDLTSVKLSVPDSEFMARQPLLTLWSPIRQNARAGPSTPLPWTTRLVLHRREWPWVLQGTVPCRLAATHTSFNRCHTFRGTHSDSFL